MYQEMKVYESPLFPSERFSCGHYADVYTCRGVAHDNTPPSDGEVYESRVLYNKADKALLKEAVTLYRAISPQADECTSWFLSKVEAEESAKRSMHGQDCDIQKGVLCMREIAPLTFPVQVIFSLDEKGRPYTRLNAHPERDGTVGKGKVFFPDRSFAGADVGRAIVSISKEFETYGFLTGEMEKFEMPDMQVFLNWAWDELCGGNLSAYATVLFINHPGRGNYLGVDNKRVIPVCAEDGTPTVELVYDSNDWLIHDKVNYLETELTLTDLLLQDSFGPNISFESLFKRFSECEFLTGKKKRVKGDWCRSGKYHGQLIDEAVGSGLLTQYVLDNHNIEAFTINGDKLYTLAAFSEEEMDELVAEVSKVNQAADEAIITKLRKGKMQLMHV